MRTLSLDVVEAHSRMLREIMVTERERYTYAVSLHEVKCCCGVGPLGHKKYPEKQRGSDIKNSGNSPAEKGTLCAPHAQNS